MEQELILEGKWWSPENPENIIMGILRASPENGLILDLSYESQFDFSNMGKERLKKIHEETAFGLNPEIIIGEVFKTSLFSNEITLYKCFKRTENLSNTIFKTSYEVTNAFHGFRFLKTQDIKFDTISIDFSGLHDWVKISLFQDQYESNKKRHVLEYKRREEIPLIKTKEYEIFLELSVKPPSVISTRSFAKKEISYKQETKIKLYFVDTKNFEDCLNIAYTLRDFLNLMIFAPVQIISMTGTIDTPQQFKPIQFGEIKFPSSYLAAQPKSLRIYEILIPYNNVKDNIEKLLQNWLKKAGDLRPICDFYFDSFRNPDTMAESTFLSLIIAFESYLNNLMFLESEKIRTDELRKIRDEIIKKCKSYKEIILNQFWIRINLRDRLRDLLERLEPVCEKIVPKSEWENFLSKIIITRNYLTHHSKKLEKRIAKGAEFIKIIHQLRLILNIYLLQELGLDLAFIEQLIEESHRYQFELKKIELITQGKIRKL